QLLVIGVDVGQAAVEVADDRNRRKLGLHDAFHAHQYFVHVDSAIRRRAVRREQAIDERAQPIGLGDDDLRVFDERGTIELALEQLRCAADAAERVLDLVREASDQFAIGLLLLEQPLLARDLELLVDMPELEQQRRLARVDRRYRAREMQPGAAERRKLELLLGVRRTGGDRLVDRGGKRRAHGEQLGERMTRKLPPRQFEQVLGGRIRVDDAA